MFNFVELVRNNFNVSVLIFFFGIFVFLCLSYNVSLFWDIFMLWYLEKLVGIRENNYEIK